MATIEKSPMLAKKFIAIIVLMALPGLATAKDYALTAYAGYRGGGNFTDSNTEKSLELEVSGAYSLALDMPLDASRQYQIFLSHQRTDLLLNSASSTGRDKLAMDITYLHFGGTNFFEGEIGKGLYLVGGVGATLFDPAQGYSNELYASMNLGFGYQWPLNDALAVRLEARGYATLVNSSGGIFCSGGCIVSVQGDVVTQGELMLGLSGRF